LDQIGSDVMQVADSISYWGLGSESRLLCIFHALCLRACNTMSHCTSCCWLLCVEVLFFCCRLLPQSSSHSHAEFRSISGFLWCLCKRSNTHIYTESVREKPESAYSLMCLWVSLPLMLPLPTVILCVSRLHTCTGSERMKPE
jgi:hypothetical protein